MSNASKKPIWVPLPSFSLSLSLGRSSSSNRLCSVRKRTANSPVCSSVRCVSSCTAAHTLPTAEVRQMSSRRSQRTARNSSADTLPVRRATPNSRVRATVLLPAARVRLSSSSALPPGFTRRTSARSAFSSRRCPLRQSLPAISPRPSQPVPLVMRSVPRSPWLSVRP